MTTGLTYSQYVTQIATMAVVAEDDAAYVTILPQMITYAENRICRDIDFLSTVSANTTYSLSSGSRSVSVAVGDFVTLQEVNVITPVGTTNPDAGTRNPLLPVDKTFLDFVYPSSTGAAVPQFFAMIDQSKFIVGPWPDASYALEIIGTVRPASLSASNTTTFISTYLPDLLIMASMIYISAYQRNFGRQSDDPQMALSYEQQYKALLEPAMIEEARKKFSASAWTSMAPPVAATPTRG